MKPMESAQPVRRRNGRGQRGVEMVEFTLTLIPYLCILFVLLDASWAIFAKATLLYAVRTGVRNGITITGTQAATAGETLTQMVKDSVQANALGLLNGTNRSYIQVHYLEEDPTNLQTGVTDVSTQSYGNNPGNIMQVSVNSYPLTALLPRIYTLFTPVDHNPSIITAVAADRIEPSGDVPPIGSAP